MDLIDAFARRTRNVAAQRVLAGMGAQYREAVLANPDCDPDLWIELYQTTGPNKISPAAAKGAILHRVDTRQMDHLLTVEKRASVIAEAFTNTMPSGEQLTSDNLVGFLSQKSVGRTLTGAWAPFLDPEVLAQLPAEALTASLRVWRMTAISLSDDEVVAELDTFEDWKTGFSQQVVLSWVLYRRPHLVARLLDTPSQTVRCQVATSPYLGRLTLDQQRQILDLDKTVPAAEAAVYANQRIYTWMAAAANPTFAVELLDELGKAAEPQYEVGDYRRTLENRRSYNNWTVPSLDTEVTADQMPRLIRWVLPSNYAKGRPAALIELLRNPSLEAADALTLTAPFTGHFGLPRVTWYHPDVREALVRAELRFPELAAEGVVAGWDTLVANTSLGWAARQAGLVLPEPEPEVFPEASATIADWKVETLAYDQSGQALRYLEDRLGDNDPAWSMFFTMVGEVLTTSLADAADLCEALLV